MGAWRGLADPNIVLLLLVVATIGIGLEALNPGAFVPGLVGVLAALAAIPGLVSGDLQWAGILLVALGIGLFVAEILTGTWVGAVLGIVAFAAGATLLFDRAGDSTSVGAAIVAAVVLGVGSGLVGRRGAGAQDPAPVTGASALVGQVAEVKEVVTTSGGVVMVAGELWSARTEQGKLARGTRCQVTHVDTDRLMVVVAMMGS
jgi:membrane-bound serine protease (ClpP class)